MKKDLTKEDTARYDRAWYERNKAKGRSMIWTFFAGLIGGLVGVTLGAVLGIVASCSLYHA